MPINVRLNSTQLVNMHIAYAPVELETERIKKATYDSDTGA